MISQKDKQLTRELGFEDLPELEQEKRLKQYKETLRIRVGLRLEQELDDNQLEKVVKLMDRADINETEKWLEVNIPNYASLVKDEEEKLKQAIKNDTGSIKSIIEKF